MVVHNPDRLTNFRDLTSWAFFTFAAGAVNLGAFAACKRFVAHVTGTLTLIGADSGQVLALDYFLVLLCFIAGAMASVILVRRFGSVEKGLPYWIPLTLVSVMLAAVAILGHFGAFGAFGGTVETAHDFALLCILSFAMGMQNAAVASSTGMAVRTTHMTGPATDLAIAAGTLLAGEAGERRKALSSIVLRGTKLASFVLGAAVMVPACSRFGFAAFIIPAAACAAATISSFAPSRIAALVAERARA